MKGSWAGAMGNMQFMPSTFTRWAVDRDGNGRIDIWNSLPDAFASAANFLRGIGFKPGLPAADEVSLPQNFPLDQADSTVEKPVRAWAAMGVKRAGGAALPTSDEPSSIILPAGWRGPAFILYPNFKAVMSWNRSTLYALSVAMLAQQIAGGSPVMQPPPSDDEPLSRNTVVDLQTRLAKLGFYTDEADGLLGPKTRSAVRLFQKQAGLPADGHPTPDMVARLQRAVR
jgi:membrane-bound lytic murein transglycosylase B